MVSVKTTALELPFFFILKRQYTEQLADRQADQFTDDSNQLKQLSRKITKEYAISCHDYLKDMEPAEIVIRAYQKAQNLFDPDSENSISDSTLSFYRKHMDEAIECYIKGLDTFQTLSRLLLAFKEAQELRNAGVDAMKEKFSAELINNRSYYALFDVDYYLERARTDCPETSLAELEEDVNIRANTYYNAAYKEFLDILPEFEDIIDAHINTS